MDRAMIILFTDFGPRGPYVGQMQSVLAQQAPAARVIELFNDAPRFDPQAASYLLAAYVSEFPAGSVFLCVVDPGVGSRRKALMLEVDGYWFVGPDNGLFDVVAQRGKTVHWYEITWRPRHLSSSFHGRDLFAPVAAALARGDRPACKALTERTAVSVAEDLARIIYFDSFGNAMTGLRAAHLPAGARLCVADHVFQRARTFSAVGDQEMLWYENANGLAELAVNQNSARDLLGLRHGDAVSIEQSA